jgi:hypothetical protein
MVAQNDARVMAFAPRNILNSFFRKAGFAPFQCIIKNASVKGRVRRPSPDERDGRKADIPAPFIRRTSAAARLPLTAVFI